MKNKTLKLITLFSVGGLVLVLASILIVPHFVRIDSYRPEIVRAVNEQINGRFELGGLKLDLWGKIAVSVENAQIKDTRDQSVISVGRFFVKVPFLSILKMSPEVRVELDSPKISLERSKKGEWNVLGLLQTKKAGPVENTSSDAFSAPQPTEKVEPVQETTKPSSSVDNKSSGAALAFLAKTKVSLKIEEASLQLKDNQAQRALDISSVFLRTGPLSLQAVPEFEAGAQVKSVGEKLSLQGPVLIAGKSVGKELELVANLNDLKIEQEGVFSKKPGVVALAKVSLSIVPDGLELKNGTAQFHQAQLKYQGQLKATGSSTVQIAASDVDLKPFETLLVAMPKDAVSGKLTLNVEIQGPVESLEGQIKSRVENFSFQSKTYPKPVQFSAEFTGKMKLGKVPEGNFIFLANSVDAAGIQIQPVKIQAKQVGMQVQASMAEAQTLGGKVSASFSLDMSGKAPQYRFSQNLKGISIEKAVASQVDFFKNTLVGSLDGAIEGESEGFDPELAKKNLKATGTIEIKPARFSTIDINKVISEVSTQMAQKLESQVPQLKGRTLKLDPVASEFNKATASFKISNGEFASPDFFAESIPKKGVDIRGSTRLGIIDYRLSADWEVSDPHNVTKAKDLSVDLAGIKVDSILVEKGKPFKFPIKVRGTLLDPKYEYGSVPEAIAQVALRNISSAAQEKAKGEAKKKAQEELQKLSEKAPAPVKNLLKGLFK